MLVLVGCSPAPTGGGTAGGGSSGQTDGNETSTDSDDGQNDVDLEAFGELPATFPIDDVPLIDAPVHLAIDLGTGWSVQLAVDDFQSSFTDAADKLKAAGYEAVAEQLSADGGVGVFRNDAYQVQLTAGDSPDVGNAVSYVVIIRE